MGQPAAGTSPTPFLAAPLPPTLLAPAHRLLLVQWMCAVAGALGLQRGTLGLGVGLLDRWAAAGAAKAPPPTSMFQLAALACMSLAIKYEEVRCLRPADWLALAIDEQGQHLYTACDLQRMEWAVLCAVGWRLHVPTPFTFMHHFLACLPPARPAASAAATPQRLSPAASQPACHSPYTSPFDGAAADAAAAGAAAATGSAATPHDDGILRRQSSDVSSMASSYGSAAAGEGAPTPAAARAPPAAQGPGWWPVVHGSLAVLERSLQHAPLQRYPPSTLALAALAVAEAEAAGGTSGGAVTDDVYGSRSSPAVAAVCAAAGVPAERLAPGLASCCEEMGERCRGGAPGGGA